MNDQPEVRLRTLAREDALVFAAWGADRLFCEHAGWSPNIDPPERIAWWTALIAQPPSDLLRITALSAGEVVGYVDLHGSELDRRELGYVIGGRERWHRGLGTAVARAGLAYGFEVLGLRTIWAEAVDANAASVSILRSIGMKETGRGLEADFLGAPSFYRRFELSAPQ